jgi:hypothetical protein
VIVTGPGLAVAAPIISRLRLTRHRLAHGYDRAMAATTVIVAWLSLVRLRDAL